MRIETGPGADIPNGGLCPRTKYEKWYTSIVERARVRALDAYKEAHHISPRSLGGSDCPSNLVDLTYREHFLAHWLLTKICEGQDRRKMVMALLSMTMTIPKSGRTVAGWRVDLSKRLLRNEWEKRARERRNIERQELQRVTEIQVARLAREESNKAAIAAWAKSNSVKQRNEAGRFGKSVKRRRKRRPRSKHIKFAA